jgi:hypothetical protein
LCDSLEGFVWLYRGVPEESPEVEDVRANGEVYPRRPGVVGEYERYCHSVNEMTDTGYTSWTTDPAIAEELAQYARREAGLTGSVVIFQVRISSIEKRRIFKGEEREDEYLIEGTVENVEFSEDADDEDDDED